MIHDIDNWKAQIRKGYLDLCILLLIANKKRVYGLEILETLKYLDLPIKEGTLYPLLNRMASDGVLSSEWETENVSGHPRKFYSLAHDGRAILNEMQKEFDKLTSVYTQLSNMEEK
jgi:PadR family transcriptional regulator, regulatory protein PadR